MRRIIHSCTDIDNKPYWLWVRVRMRRGKHMVIEYFENLGVVEKTFFHESKKERYDRRTED